MNKLYFELERDFDEPIILIANNEVDLENHLTELGFSKINFYDLRCKYGNCCLSDIYDSYVAKCYYVKQV